MVHSEPRGPADGARLGRSPRFCADSSCNTKNFRSHVNLRINRESPIELAYCLLPQPFCHEVRSRREWIGLKDLGKISRGERAEHAIGLGRKQPPRRQVATHPRLASDRSLAFRSPTSGPHNLRQTVAAARVALRGCALAPNGWAASPSNAVNLFLNELAALTR
jgi:hypothetical protein